MQIIGGTARRIHLIVPEGLVVRPTAGRSKEALFNSLGVAEGLNVVDLCAGCGSLGLEAASRGAKSVTLVERSSTNCEKIEENISRIVRAGVMCEIKVLCQDVSLGNFVSMSASPDWIFADPPYADSFKYFNELLGNERFVRWAANAMLIWEIPNEPGMVGNFLYHPKVNGKVRNFGGTNFLLARINA